MNCPNCKSELVKNPKHAQGVFHCENCDGNFFIIVTSTPKKQFPDEELIAVRQLLKVCKRLLKTSGQLSWLHLHNVECDCKSCAIEYTTMVIKLID